MPPINNHTRALHHTASPQVTIYNSMSGRQQPAFPRQLLAAAAAAASSRSRRSSSHGSFSRQHGRCKQNCCFCKTAHKPSQAGTALMCRRNEAANVPQLPCISSSRNQPCRTTQARQRNTAYRTHQETCMRLRCNVVARAMSLTNHKHRVTTQTHALLQGRETRAVPSLHAAQQHDALCRAPASRHTVRPC